MLLSGKAAIVYGGDEAAGSALASAFAREGARVFLTGRSQRGLAEVAAAVRGTGGRVEFAELDVLDQGAVEAHAYQCASAAGGIDIAVNATAGAQAGGMLLADMTPEDIVRPVTAAVTGHVITAAAAARQMSRRGRGVIMTVADGLTVAPDLGGAYPAHAALAGLYRQLACELAPDGIRVIWLVASGPPSTPDCAHGSGVAHPATVTVLNQPPDLGEVASAAAVLAAPDW
jgi:3-oxoacyl-[acyl-carrier protein] reductase